MSAVFTLLTIILPVFMVVGAGWGMVRLKLFPDAGVDGLVRFATGFAVPILLFQAMYNLDFSAALWLEHQVSFYGPSLACFALGMLLAWRVWKRNPDVAVAVGFCALFPNSVLLGLPIMERAYGRLDELYALITFHAAFCYSVGILTMEFCRRDGATPIVALRKAAVAICHNALMIGMVAGIAANLTGLALPGPVLAAVDTIAGAALPVALFGLGGVLTRYTLSENMGEALMVTGLSLIVHPALAWLMATQIFALPEPFVQSVVVMAAMPAGMNAYIFSALYGRAQGTAASAVLITTVLSLATIPVWLAVVG